MCTTMYISLDLSTSYYSARLQFSGEELTYIHVSLYFRAAYAMLIAARLPKDTDVSFITEMIEVCNQPFNLRRIRFIIIFIYFARNDDSYMKYYLKIVTLESAAMWKFPSVKWQGLGRLFSVADMVHNYIEGCILHVPSQCLFSMLLFMQFIHSLVLI